MPVSERMVSGRVLKEHELREVNESLIAEVEGDEWSVPLKMHKPKRSIDMKQRTVAIMSAPLTAAVAYGTISLAITFFNKAALSVYKLNSNILSLGQMFFSLIFLYVTRHYKLLDFPQFDWKVLKKTIWLGLSFFGMVTTGLAALRYLNIPTFSTLRRGTTLVVIGVEWFVQGTLPSFITTMSVIVMVLGAAVATGDNPLLNFWGLFFVTLNIIVTALYLSLSRKVGEITKINNFGLMFYNNLVSLPLLLVLSIALGEVGEFVSAPFLGKPLFWFFFTMSCLMAFWLNYSIFWCSRVNSPLTTSVTGQVKTMFQTALGMVDLFGDFELRFLNAMGLIVGTLGSMWYSFLKFRESQEKKGSPPGASASVKLGAVK